MPEGVNTDFWSALSGGQNGGGFLGSVLGSIGTGGLGFAGNLAQLGLSEMLGTGDSAGQRTQDAIDNSINKNIGRFTRSATRTGYGAELEAQRTHGEQKYSPQALMQINSANQSADNLSSMANQQGNTMMSLAGRQAGSMGKDMRDMAYASGGSPAAIAATGAKASQGMGEVYDKMLGNMSSFASDNVAKGQQLRAQGAETATNMFNTDYITKYKPHEITVDTASAANAGIGAVSEANNARQNENVMPANPLKPAGDLWQSMLNKQAGINAFSNNVSQ